MPRIGFEGNIETRLACLDGDKPDAERAVFICNDVTARETLRMEQLREEALREQSETAMDAKLDEAIGLAVVGWRGLRDAEGRDVPFTPEALGEFTFRLKIAIVAELPTAILIGTPQKPAAAPATA